MRVVAAMSGGVDSSVAAALLVREGHEVSGAYMKNWINEEGIIGHCPWEEDITDARAVADGLDPFEQARMRQSIRLAFVAALRALLADWNHSLPTRRV